MPIGTGASQELHQKCSNSSHEHNRGALFFSTLTHRSARNGVTSETRDRRHIHDIRRIHIAPFGKFKKG